MASIHFLQPSHSLMAAFCDWRHTMKLNNVTWVLGDSPCKTLRKSAGCWVDQTNDKYARHGNGGKIGGKAKAPAKN